MNLLLRRARIHDYYSLQTVSESLVDRRDLPLLLLLLLGLFDEPVLRLLELAIVD